MMTEGVNNTIVYERPKEEIDEVMRSLWEIAQWIAIELWNIMRALHSGSASAFQADSAGSIPAARSITSFRWRIWRKKIPEKNLKKGVDKLESI